MVVCEDGQLVEKLLNLGLEQGSGLCNGLLIELGAFLKVDLDVSHVSLKGMQSLIVITVIAGLGSELISELFHVIFSFKLLHRHLVLSQRLGELICLLLSFTEAKEWLFVLECFLLVLDNLLDLLISVFLLLHVLILDVFEGLCHLVLLLERSFLDFISNKHQFTIISLEVVFLVQLLGCKEVTTVEIGVSIVDFDGCLFLE